MSNKQNELCSTEVTNVESARKYVWTVVLNISWIGTTIDGSDDRDWEVELPIKFLSEHAALDEAEKWNKVTKHYGKRRHITARIRMR